MGLYGKIKDFANEQKELLEGFELQNDFRRGEIAAYSATISFISTLEESVNKELGRELDKWRHSHFNGVRDGHFSGEYLERISQLDLAHHFAQWQKEQMMKGGDEGVVRKVGSIGYITFTDEQQFNSRLEQFQDRDKVRIIILKEN